MPVNMEILTEFDEMKSDFKRIDCNIRIRECSECDLDLDLQLWTRENFAAAFSKMLNWNRILLEKYPIWLEVQIFDAKGKHIFDFDGRVRNAYGRLPPT